MTKPERECGLEIIAMVVILALAGYACYEMEMLSSRPTPPLHHATGDFYYPSN